MKQVKFDDSALESIKYGIEKMAKAVSSTMGPMGRNVIIDQEHDAPIMTKDGVSVARAMFDSDKFENVAMKILKEVAAKTEEEAGDGTTTSIVLADEIFKKGLSEVNNGADPVALNKDLHLIKEALIEGLNSIAIPADTNEMIENVASISANNNEEIGKLMADAYDKVGVSGVVTVEDSPGFETNIEVVNGMQFDKGYISPYFINAPKDACILEKPYVLIYDGKFNVVDDLTELLEATKRAGRSLVIIAQDVAGVALSTLITNKIGDVLKVCAVKAPGFGEWQKGLMEDIAVATGATVVKDVKTIGPDVLGQADSFSASANSSTIVGGYSTDQDVAARCAYLKTMMEDAVENSVEERKFKERLAKLSGGVGVVYVGGSTELEKKEKKDRVIDALHAVQSAKEEGVVPGGGFALPLAWDAVDIPEGVSSASLCVMRSAINAPACKIVENAGISRDMYLQARLGKSGFNTLTGEECDMMEAGIMDPKKVTRCALENAVSIAGLLLTTSCAITDDI